MKTSASLAIRDLNRNFSRALRDYKLFFKKANKIERQIRSDWEKEERKIEKFYRRRHKITSTRTDTCKLDKFRFNKINLNKVSQDQ